MLAPSSRLEFLYRLFRSPYKSRESLNCDGEGEELFHGGLQQSVRRGVGGITGVEFLHKPTRKRGREALHKAVSLILKLAQCSAEGSKKQEKMSFEVLFVMAIWDFV